MSTCLYLLLFLVNHSNLLSYHIDSDDTSIFASVLLSKCYKFIYLMLSGHKWWCLWIDEVVCHDIFLCPQIHSWRQVTWGTAADWHLVISPLTSHSCRSRHSDIFPSRPIRVNSSPRFEKIKYGNFIKVLVFCGSCSRSFRGGTYCFL